MKLRTDPDNHIIVCPICRHDHFDRTYQDKVGFRRYECSFEFTCKKCSYNIRFNFCPKMTDCNTEDKL